jgi:hypothetical protein
LYKRIGVSKEYDKKAVKVQKIVQSDIALMLKKWDDMPK